MKKKLGVVIDNLTNDYKSICILSNLNQLSDDYDICLFYENIKVKPIQTAFSVVNCKDMYFYDGILLGTSESTINRILNCFLVKQKFYYIWNTDWIYKYKISYENLNNIYNNKDITTICRTQSQSKLIESTFRKPNFIIEEFDYERLSKII